MNYEISYKHFDRVKDHSGPRLEPLAPGIIASIKSAFGNPNFDEEDIRDHIAGDLIILGMIDQLVASYSSINFGISPREQFDTPGLTSKNGCYFVAGTVSAEYQANGLYGELNQRRITAAVEAGHDLIFTRTQNPFVEAGISSAILRLGLSASLERIVAPNCYGTMLTREQPRYKDMQIQSHYDDLNYDNGDAFILLYKLNGDQYV